MRRRAVNRWLKSCVLGPVLAAGCQHYGAGYTLHAPSMASDGGTGTTQAVVYLYSETPIDGQAVASDRLPRMTTTVYAPAYKPAASVAKKTEKPAESPTAETIQTADATPPKGADKETIAEVSVAPASMPSMPMASLSAPTEKQPTKSEPKSGDVATVDSLPSTDVRQAEAPAPDKADAQVRQASAPTSADGSKPTTAFWHNEDHTELYGQLQNTRLTKGWRLRYCPIDEVDEYGGSVRFTDDSQVEGFQDGQIVRVRGRLVVDGTRIAPYFRVDSIEAVKE